MLRHFAHLLWHYRHGVACQADNKNSKETWFTHIFGIRTSLRLKDVLSSLHSKKIVNNASNDLETIHNTA